MLDVEKKEYLDNLKKKYYSRNPKSNVLLEKLIDLTIEKYKYEEYGELILQEIIKVGSDNDCRMAQEIILYYLPKK